MNKFGFLGLGIMGSAMAKNLLKAGFDVTVWNRSPEKCSELVALGAKTSATPRQVVESCGITFAMLSDPAAAEAVCFGTDGVLASVGVGLGDRLGQPLFTAAAANEAFKRAKALGFGDEDFSALFKAIET